MLKIKKITAIILAVLTMALMTVPMSISAATTNYTIDTTMTGSLNIYKYEMEDLSDATVAGTGQVTDEDNVPAEATPLEGVTFTVTRVANLVDDSGNINTTYYTTAGLELPTASEAASMTAIETYTVTTDASGFATLTDLPLGIYLVQETSGPAHITEKVADFVVSVPMTQNNSTWDYDVYAYPKNETAYTEFTIEKVDEQTGEAIEGAVFKLARSETNSNYTTIETNIETDENGIATPTVALPVNNYYKITETAAAEGYIFDTPSPASATIYVNVDGEVCDVDTKTPTGNNNVITITNSKPTISKYVKTSDGTWGSDVTNAATDSSEYKIEVYVPNISTRGLKDISFVVTDTADTALGEPQNVTITCDSTTLTADTDYTQTYDSSTGVTTWTFKMSTGNITPGSTITIEYSYSMATAGADTSNYGKELTNVAQLTYSTIIWGNDKYTIDTDTVETHLSGYCFMKTNESNNALSGAEFKIYKTKADALADTNAVEAYNGNNSMTAGTYTDTFSSNSEGYVKIYGLAYDDDIDGSATYYLVETKAPDGYNLLSAPVEITVDKSSYEYANTGAIVKNSKKTDLPVTGGLSFIIFGTLGLLLIAGGTATYIYSRKRKKSTNDAK